MPSSSPGSNLLLVAGPTGSGKSLFAASLASRVRGEIVCGDAFQLYRGLAVLTAQPGEALLRMAPHHLYGILDPAEPCDAAAYSRRARAVCAEIRRRGNRPVVVGGSGLYLRALVHGFHEFPPPDPALRAELNRETPEALATRLIALDPGSATRVDLKNPRRVQRAVEITLQTGKPWSQWLSLPEAPALPHTGIVLDRPLGVLEERLRANVDALWRDGAVDEVRRLLSQSSAHGSVSAQAARAIGFGQIRNFLSGHISESKARGEILLATRQYAKRQRTWFRNQTPEWMRIDPQTTTPEKFADMLQTE